MRWFGIRGVSRRGKIQVRVNVDLAALPGPPGFLQGSWMQVSGGDVTGADIAAWPKSVGLLCNFVAVWGSLHWPSDAGDVGHFGVSYLEVLILFEHWLGHRLLSEKVTRMHHLRANRPFYVPPAPVTEGVQIRLGCQYISSFFRALGKLSGGLSRFIPGSIGGDMSGVVTVFSWSHI